jgi:hypothetical protein
MFSIRRSLISLRPGNDTVKSANALRSCIPLGLARIHRSLPCSESSGLRVLFCRAAN